jgi:hypothetical protein
VPLQEKLYVSARNPSFFLTTTVRDVTLSSCFTIVFGAVAQLGEHKAGSLGVRGSIPLSSTKISRGWSK